MSQNPNDPYNLQSQWNPFPPNYNPQTPQSSSYNPYPTQASNSQMPGFGQTYNIPHTQVPSTQYPQSSSSQFPQMTPETYHEFMLWKQNQAPPLEHSVEAETPTSSRPKKSKSKQPGESKKKKVISVRNLWTSKEELLLAQCWICISECPNRGIDQKGDSFWYLVVDEYNKRADVEKVVQRGKDALSSKWKYLNNRCQKYQGIHARLGRKKHSGEKDDDFRLRCLETYKFEAKAAFHHEVAWDYLKDKQKWLVPDPVVVGRRNKRRETVDLEDIDLDLGHDEEDEENPNAALFGEDVHPRPPGKSRRSKSAKTSSDTSTKSSTPSFDESITTNFEQLTQSKASVYRTRDIAEAMRVLKMSTDGLSEDDAWFLNMEKEKIRAKFGWKRPGSGGGSGSEDVDGSGSEDV